MEDKIIDALDYRGFHIDFYDDDYGQQVYAKWNGETLGFGAFNTMYKEDMRGLIDGMLDTIDRFDDLFYGAKLSWFDNCGHRDIKLEYRLRIIKVWVIADEFDHDKVNLELIKQQAIEALDKVGARRANEDTGV